MILNRHANLIAGGILLLMFIVSASVSRQDSNIVDEKAHLPAAYSYIKYQDMRLNPEHPPLMKDLAGLPLLFLHLDFPLDDPHWLNGVNEQWSLGVKFLYGNGNDPDTISFWARTPIILTAILLGIFIYLWTKELAGALAGLFALTLYAFDPNILAHGHYVTTDIGIACFLFISAYFFVRFLKQPSVKNTVLSGIFLGLAQVAKFSAVVLFPFFALLAILFALVKPPSGNGAQAVSQFRHKTVLAYFWKYSVVVAICFFVIGAIYAFNAWNMPKEKIQEIARTFFSEQGAEALAKSFILQMSATPCLKALSVYFLGVFMVLARVASGNIHYFLGNVSVQGAPLYFPLLFLLKETLPFLLLIFFSICYRLLCIYQSFADKTIFWRTVVARSVFSGIAEHTMIGFVVVYSFLGIIGNLNLGLRHLFPIFPFLYVLVAITLSDFLKRPPPKAETRAPYDLSGPFATHRVRFSLLGLFTVWIAAISAQTYPDYLSYYNEAAGGSRNGYRYATDSNYDWGQDLKRLKSWVDQYNHCTSKLAGKTAPPACSKLTANGKLPTTSPIGNLRIDYFGGAEPEYYFGKACSRWTPGIRPEPGWFAVSVSSYQFNLHADQNPEKTHYQWLAHYQPVARAGQSIFIFYISPDSLAR